MSNPLHYMQQAMMLAERGRGLTSPNPFVGAVVVKDDIILGEGFTQPWGYDHAEIQAMKSACQKLTGKPEITDGCLTGCTLYVTLEPCAHQGKTPPCALAVIKSGITAVYAGITDPNPKVNGKGFALLREAGIRVEQGFMQSELTRQMEYYLTYITKKRPFVMLKSALTLDGRIAAADGTSRWITGETSRHKVHELRQECDVLLTGIGTVLADDPLLNVRLPQPRKQPIRAIMDTHLDIPLSSQIVKTAQLYPTLIFTSQAAQISPKYADLQKAGIEVIPLPQDKDGKVQITDVLQAIYDKHLYLVMVEAGCGVNTSFLRSGLVDKLHLFYAPKLLGGHHLSWHDIGISTLSKALTFSHIDTETLDTDIHITASITI